MTQGVPTGEVWIPGATGRIGRAVASCLSAQGVTPALVGRNGDRLREIGSDLGEVKVVVADSAERMAAEIARQRPAAVVNTIGAYAETAALIARACLPGGHYVDLAADLTAIPRLLDLHQDGPRRASSPGWRARPTTPSASSAARWARRSSASCSPRGCTPLHTGWEEPAEAPSHPVRPPVPARSG
jgi:saccharopine dehydrogenase-like NADP-dependent oxidoreductase